MKLKNCMVMSYLIKDIPERSQRTVLDKTSWGIHNDSWAIRCCGQCFNKNGEWEWEPSPSNRDDKFLVRCRWTTPEEALDCWDLYH
jgi:hypothetical protein